MIYLDNNATTAVCQASIDAMVRIWQVGPMNPSSSHAAGRRAAAELADQLDALLDLLGATSKGVVPDRIVLTSGGTESNNLVLTRLVPKDAVLAVSAVEHSSVLEAARALASAGQRVVTIPVDRTGIVRLDELERILHEQHPALVSVMTANNETGALQPIRQVVSLCRETSTLVHTDAAQAIGKIPVSFTQLGVDAMTIAAHKFHGPPGVGALLIRSGLSIQPLMYGGQQQLGARPGTEAVALAAGMRAAAQETTSDLSVTSPQMQQLRDRFETQLSERLPRTVFHSQSVPRLPGTSCFSLPGADRQAMLMALDFAGVACSSGSACASGSSQPSHTLTAMGVEPALQHSALRLGFSRYSTAAEADQAVELICRAYNKLVRG